MYLLNYFLITITLFACSRKTPTASSGIGHEDSINKTTITSATDQKTPGCILVKIDSIKREPVWNPPAEIYEYEYQGKKVYAISSNCCDFFNTVVDEACTYVCAPSGGFTGRGDGKCKDFFKAAKQIRLVWKDERKRN
jgi:hypothetical protein